MVYILSANVCPLVCFGDHCIIADHTLSHNFLVEWFCFCGFKFMIVPGSEENKSNFCLCQEKFNRLIYSNINIDLKTYRVKLYTHFLLTHVLNEKGDQWLQTLHVKESRKGICCKKFTLVSICCFIFCLCYDMCKSNWVDLPGLDWVGWWRCPCGPHQPHPPGRSALPTHYKALKGRSLEIRVGRKWRH
jgi:hypothetical protein